MQSVSAASQCWGGLCRALGFGAPLTCHSDTVRLRAGAWPPPQEALAVSGYIGELSRHCSMPLFRGHIHRKPPSRSRDIIPITPISSPRGLFVFPASPPEPGPRVEVGQTSQPGASGTPHPTPSLPFGPAPRQLICRGTMAAALESMKVRLRRSLTAAPTTSICDIAANIQLPRCRSPSSAPSSTHDIMIFSPWSRAPGMAPCTARKCAFRTLLCMSLFSRSETLLDPPIHFPAASQG